MLADGDAGRHGARPERDTRGIHLPRDLEPLYLVPHNQILRLANDARTPGAD